MLIHTRPLEAAHAGISLGETLVLGTLHLRDLPPADVFAVLDAFFSLGGKYLDVATLYGGMTSLENIGSYLRSSCAPARVFVKIGYFENAEQYHDLSLVSSRLDAALEAIGPCATAGLLHEADWRVWWAPGARPQELCTQDDVPMIAARLYALVRALQWCPLPLGIAGNNAEALSLVQTQCSVSAPVLVAKQYDLLWRNAMPLVRRAQAQGSPLILGAPWHQGWLRDLGRLIEQRPTLASAAARLRSLAAQAGVTVDELALPFIRYQAPSALIAFGARSPSEVRQAFAGAGRAIPGALLAELESLGMKMPPMGPLIHY